MRRWLLAPFFGLAFGLSACAAGLQGAPSPDPMVNYHGDTRGYLAQSAGAGPRPAVVMIHEWWGLNDQIKAQADKLAQAGYTVLAVDLMKGKVATSPEEARALTQGVSEAEAIANLQGAVSYMRGRPEVDGAKVASLGWCFGGGWSLRLLKAQKDLAAGVMYYGAVDTDAANLRGLPPLLGIFGAEDTNPAPAQVQAFDAALGEAGVAHEIHIYPDAGHAFANPTGGDRYRPEAAEDAWAKTLAFLAARLK